MSVEKIDRIVNLVGELVIAQAMLQQAAASAAATADERLAHSLATVDRNTRKTRHGLDGITDEVRTANKRTTQVADGARRALEVARSEVGTLNAATIEQTRQIEVTLTRINELSVEIRKDINQIIVAMQFQDITRQKLERVHKPTLAATEQSLALLSHETQALLQRDLYRAVRAYAQSAIRLSAGRDDGLESTARQVDETREAAPAAAREEKKVELF